MTISTVSHSPILLGAGTTTAIDTTGADFLCISVMAYQTLPTVTDSKGNTYTSVTVTGGANGQQKAALYYCFSPTVGTGHTATIAGGTVPSCMLAAFSGVSAYDQDGFASAGSNATTLQPSVTPANNGSLILSALNADSAGGASIDSSYTILAKINGINGNSEGLALAYLVQSTAAASSPTWTFPSVRAVAGIFAFEPAGGGGSVTASGGVDSTVPALSGSGVVSISGSGGVNATVPALAGSGTVAGTVDGSGAINATVPTLAASGKVQIDASGGVQSTVPTLSGSATVSIAGSGGVSATVPTLAGTATHAIPASGGVNATVPALDGSGVVQIAGSGGVTASVPNLAGTGDAVGGAVTGSGAISATVIQLHGSGSVVGGASRGDDAGSRWAPRGTRPIRVIYDEEDVREVLGEPKAKAAKPTKAKKRKLVQSVEQKVISASPLPAVFTPVVQRAISQEIGTAWKGPSDWEVLSAILNVAAQKAVEEIQRIQREIEEEDELILLLAA